MNLGIYENYNNEIGVSAINLNDYKLYLSQFFDNYSYKKLMKKLTLLSPNEVNFYYLF